MDQINYVGETLWVGQAGNFFIVLGFISAILAAAAYSLYQFGVNKVEADTRWLAIGRWSWITHVVSIGSVFALIMYAMLSEMYEYVYVYEHVNEVLPGEYILSAFWEGQEGSFILWMLWHLVLGTVIYKRRGKWEAPVLAVVAMVEVFLSSMLLGVYIEVGDFMYKLGSNPLLLLRDTMQIPLFTNAEYLDLLEGKGLNPLLQNYWNVIHPPTTFLGFASTTLPFAFAISGLWLGDHKGWLKPALLWALFSGGVLGTGILMGSFWAYEALTFGGYWAWDPVENGILVPWLILVAGIHTNLIARNTEYSIKASYFFYILTFVMVVYASFLTRSGILGDTSVHAFTNLGLEWQLVAFTLTPLLLGMGLLAYRAKSIPAPIREEALGHREFWMFIGSLVLLFSGALIIGSTSLPVYNTIRQVFEPDYIGSVIKDPVPHYDRYQLWIGVFVAILSSLTVFLRYGRDIKWTKLLLRFGLAAVGAVVMTFITTMWIDLAIWQHKLMAWAGWLGMLLGIDYVVNIARGKPKAMASAISHFGFAAMLLGILASGANKRHISSNPFMFKEIIDAEDAAKYVRLYKGKPLFANNYWITWQRDTLIDRTRYYTIRMDEVGPDEKIVNSFVVEPSSLLSNDFTKIAALNPDTRHYLSRDIFTNIAALPASKMDIKNYHAMEDTMQWTRYEVTLGDTLDVEKAQIIPHNLTFSPDREQYALKTHDLGVGVPMTVLHKRRSIDTVAEILPALGVEGNLLYRYPEEIENFRMRVRLADTLMDQIYIPDEEVEYTEFTIKRGESYNYGSTELSLGRLSSDADTSRYEAEPGDITVQADLIVSQQGQASSILRPIYVIRDSRPFSIKDLDSQSGLAVRLSGINPEKETFTFKIAKQYSTNIAIPIEVAENLPETNYLWFEAREFPGVNLFWGGTIFMMIGLTMGWINRRQQRERV